MSGSTITTDSYQNPYALALAPAGATQGAGTATGGTSFQQVPTPPTPARPAEADAAPATGSANLFQQLSSAIQAVLVQYQASATGATALGAGSTATGIGSTASANGKATAVSLPTTTTSEASDSNTASTTLPVPSAITGLTTSTANDPVGTSLLRLLQEIAQALDKGTSSSDSTTAAATTGSDATAAAGSTSAASTGGAGGSSGTSTLPGLSRLADALAYVAVHALQAYSASGALGLAATSEPTGATTLA